MSSRQDKKNRRMMMKIVRAKSPELMANLYTGLEHLGFFKRLVVAVKILWGENND